MSTRGRGQLVLEWRRASGLDEYQRKRTTSVGVEEGWWSSRVPEEEEGS